MTTIATWLVSAAAAALLVARAGVPGAGVVGAAAEPANWALDRIDQRHLPLDGRPFEPGGTGVGIEIYVIDSGVRIAHPAFGGRAEPIGDFFGGPLPPDAAPADVSDCASPDGHGTLNASLAAGSPFGVASAARVRVLRAAGGPTCDGTPEATRRAVEWITAHGRTPAVVNLSFRFADAALNRSIHASTAAGFLYTLSAGSAGDVTKYWGPTLPGETLIVAGVDDRDVATRSDYGAALSLFAPAVSVTGAGLRDGGKGWTPARDQSGDSYAAPLVAGVAALYLERHPRATPREVREAILAAATTGVVKNPGQSPNRLLHVVR